MLQHTACSSSLGGRQERGEEEHDRRSEGQWADAQRSAASSLGVFKTSPTVSFHPPQPPSLTVPMQGSCSCTLSSSSAADTRPPGPSCGGSATTMTWSSRRSTCFLCETVGAPPIDDGQKKSPAQRLLTSVPVGCCRIKIPPDCTTELNHNAYHFLQSVFDKHDKVSQKKINITLTVTFVKYWDTQCLVFGSKHHHSGLFKAKKKES